VGKFIGQLTLGHQMPAFWLAVQRGDSRKTKYYAVIVQLPTSQVSNYSRDIAWTVQYDLAKSGIVAKTKLR